MDTNRVARKTYNTKGDTERFNKMPAFVLSRLAPERG